MLKMVYSLFFVPPNTTAGYYVLYLAVTVLLYDLVTVSVRSVLVLYDMHWCPFGFDCVTAPVQFVTNTFRRETVTES